MRNNDHAHKWQQIWDAEIYVAETPHEVACPISIWTDFLRLFCNNHHHAWQPCNCQESSSDALVLLNWLVLSHPTMRCIERVWWQAYRLNPDGEKLTWWPTDMPGTKIRPTHYHRSCSYVDWQWIVTCLESGLRCKESTGGIYSTQQFPYSKIYSPSSQNAKGLRGRGVRSNSSLHMILVDVKIGPWNFEFWLITEGQVVTQL